MSDIVFERVGAAGLITLNRPNALNALTKPMVREMSAALDEWAVDDGVARVIIRGEGRAFCAGGDIRHVYEAREDAADFFAAEYENNAKVAAFPKPYVALIDGVVMGGGVGVSVHGSHRVGGEGHMFAMPEVGIGLVPDVGATHVLANLSHHQGRWLALTGARLDRDAAAAMGLLTHAVASERMADALDRAVHGRDLDAALDDLAVDAPPADAAQCAFIDDAFGRATVAEILDALDDADVDMAAPAAAAMREKSPTSLTLALAAQDRHTGDVFDALVTEYRVVRQILMGHDLYEGIRATVIDKDKAPRWSPATLGGVEADAIAAHFAVPDGGDLAVRP
ncbi:MAG: 3-hydroxyisobutyryl-CoA hydrolase [Pseudomonadota bacterium]